VTLPVSDIAKMFEQIEDLKGQKLDIDIHFENESELENTPDNWGWSVSITQWQTSNQPFYCSYIHGKDLIFTWNTVYNNFVNYKKNEYAKNYDPSFLSRVKDEPL
jgi:hypothetical protein